MSGLPVITRGAVHFSSTFSTADGSIGISTVSGGTAPLVYSWTSSAGATTGLAATLAAKTLLLPGEYVLTVTDAASQQASETFSVGFQSALLTNSTVLPFPVLTSNANSCRGDYFAIGAYGANVGGLTNAGVVYMYKKTSSGFVLQQTITRPTPVASGLFGSTLGTDGNTLFVTKNGGNDFFVFTRGAGTEVWTEQQVITAPQIPQSAVIRVDGDTAFMSIEDSSSNAGVVYVYTRTASVWALKFTIPSGDPTSRFGSWTHSVGSYFAVGAYTSSTNGAVYVYSYNSTSNTRLLKISPPETSLNAPAFGYRVCLVGNYLFVAAYTYSTTLNVLIGAVYVYFNANGNYNSYVLHQKLLAPATVASVTNTVFGQFLESDGNGGVWIAANASNTVTNANVLVQYTLSGTTWVPTKQISATFGQLAVSSSVLALSTQSSANIQLSPADPVVVKPTVQNALIVSSSTGAISAPVSGSITPYTISWTSSAVVKGLTPTSVAGVTSTSLTGLRAANYTLSILDGAGVSSTLTIPVRQLTLTAGAVTTNSVTNIGAIVGTNRNVSTSYTGVLGSALQTATSITLPSDYVSSTLTTITINTSQAAGATTGTINLGAAAFPWTSFSNNAQSGAALKAQNYAAGQILAVTVKTNVGGAITNPNWTITLAYSITVTGDGQIGASSAINGSGSYTVQWSSSSNSTNVSAKTTLAALTELSPGDYVVAVKDQTYPTSLVSRNYTIGTALGSAASFINVPQQAYGVNTPFPRFGRVLANDGTWLVIGEPGAYAFSSTSGTVGGVGLVNTFKITDPLTFTFGGPFANTLKAINVVGSSTSNGGHGFGSVLAVDSNRIFAGYIGETYPRLVDIFVHDTGTGNWARASPTQSFNVPAGSVQRLSAKGNVLAVLAAANTAYMYSFGTAWTLTTTLSTAGVLPSDVATTGTLTALGVVTATTPGSVNIYSLVNSSWTLLTQVLAPDGTVGDAFGTSLSLRGTTLVVGAPNFSESTTITQSGAVYVYTLSGSTATFLQQILPPNPVTAGKFGTTVKPSLTGRLLLIDGKTYLQSTGSGTYTLHRESKTGLIYSDVTDVAYIGSDNGTSNADTFSLPSVAIALSLSPGLVSAGSISATGIYGGTAPYTVSWTGLTSSSAGAKSGLSVGTYVISVTDSAATPATKTFSYSVTVPPPGPSITPGAVVNVGIFGQSTGSIGLPTLGTTTEPYTYLWTGSSAVPNPTVLEAKNNLPAGSYVFTVTDASGYISSTTYTITQPAVLSLLGGVVTAASSPTNNDGSISQIAISGGTRPYSIAWTSSATAVTAPTSASAKNGLLAGTYGVTVTDAAGSVVTRSYTVTANSALTLTGGVVTRIPIFGQATGAISAVTPSGGAGGYTFTWTNSAGASTISTPTTGAAKTGLLAGTYTLILADARAAQLTRVYVVEQNSVIAVIGGAVTNALGAANGAIAAVTVTGGSGVYTSTVWTVTGGGSALTTPTTLAAKSQILPGTYTLVITDSVGAVKTVVYTLIDTYVNMALSGGAVTHVTQYGSRNGSISNTTLTGGAAPFLYTWTTSSSVTSTAGIRTAGLSRIGAGTYVLTVTDATARTVATSFTVGQPIVASIATTDITATVSTGSMTASAVGGLGAVYSYAWKRNGVSIAPVTATITGLTIGTYECTVTTPVFSAVVVADVAGFLVCTLSPKAIRADWSAIASAMGYRVYYFIPGSTRPTLYIPATLALYCTIQNLKSAQQYTVEIHSTTDGVTYKRSYSSTVSTAAAVLANYNKSSYTTAPAVYDITTLQAAPTTEGEPSVDAIVNSAFTNGDSIKAKAAFGASKTTQSAKVLKRLFSLKVDKNAQLYIPFDRTDTGTQQSADLILADLSTKTVDYNATTNKITFDGVTYGAGEKFLLDGQRVRILS